MGLYFKIIEKTVEENITTFSGETQPQLIIFKKFLVKRESGGKENACAELHLRADAQAAAPAYPLQSYHISKNCLIMGLMDPHCLSPNPPLPRPT